MKRDRTFKPTHRKLINRRWLSPLVWLKHHQRSAAFSIRQIGQSPIGSLMTIAVIAIALALPAGLRVLVSNFENLSGGWQVSAQISLYLKPSQTEETLKNLQSRINNRSDVTSTSVLNADEALHEFRMQSGFSDALQALESNPLPAVITVTPTFKATQPEYMDQLLAELEQIEDVDMAQLDRAWLQRLEALIDLARRGIWLIGSLLVLAVWLIVGNTIRLDIQNRRQEIEIAKLIGATDAFVRRPFLYSGLIYGAGGAFGSVCLVNLAVWILQGPTSILTQLYGANATAQTLGLSGSAGLLLLGGLLGLIGAYLSVARQLKLIEPA